MNFLKKLASKKTKRHESGSDDISDEELKRHKNLDGGSFNDKLSSRSDASTLKVKKNPFGSTAILSDDFMMNDDDEIVFVDSDESENRFVPSPLMTNTEERKNKPIPRKFMNNRINLNRKSFHDVFNADIMFITDQAKSHKTKSKDKLTKETTGLFDIEADRNTFKKVNILRYRENVFRAAGRLTCDLPPFPHWIYRDKPEESLERVTFNVGGTQFQSFEDTIIHISNSKLATCVIEKSGEPVLFFDRDPTCFNYVLNFYRTGRLHAPSNTCLSFFEEELEFWGINEEFMEPCCYSQYKAYKVACNTLKKFSESKEKCLYTKKKGSSLESIKKKLYLAIIMGDKTILSQWYSISCAACIIVAIMVMFFGTSAFGRIDLNTKEFRNIRQNESLLSYFEDTAINSQLIIVELVLAGYFTADIILRCLISPNRFVFFTDTVNWIDILATLSSMISTLLYDEVSSGFNEAYIIILKIPRIFRLFKLTTNLKSGMDAIILTIRASASDLFLVFLIVVIFVSFFGVLIFVIELVNETDEPSKFTTVYIGMWWSIVTMATVGYGDYVPDTQGGYIVGCMCILSGIIICQLPVPIILRNFSIYYNQAQSRLTHQTKLLTVSIDPESIKEAQVNDENDASFLHTGDMSKMKRFSIAH